MISSGLDLLQWCAEVVNKDLMKKYQKIRRSQSYRENYADGGL
jgi:hypothetical protein